jgi:hypothetical protein
MAMVEAPSKENISSNCKELRTAVWYQERQGYTGAKYLPCHKHTLETEANSKGCNLIAKRNQAINLHSV